MYERLLPRFTNRLDRRTLLGYVLSLITGASSLSVQDDESVEIGIYITESARDQYGSNGANRVASVVETVFDRHASRDDFYIGPESVVSVPDSVKGSAKDTLSWWKEQDPEYEHSNLLIFSKDEVEWDYAGCAYLGSPYAVAYDLEQMEHNVHYQHIAVHEVGHNFSLEHHHAESNDTFATIMHPNPSADDLQPSMLFSDESSTIIEDEL